jgi:hypothetical protein
LKSVTSYYNDTNVKKYSFRIDKPIALMETASPDLEKQGFFAAVFINREYSVQQEKAPKKNTSTIF